MQPIQVYAMTTPIEMSPPMSYWKAYETKQSLWSVLNKASVPRPNQPQLLHPGMRCVIAIKNVTHQGIFAGFTNILSKSPQAVIVQELVKQEWMDEIPKMDGIQKTVWSDKIATLGGELVPIVHVPITFYSDVAQPQTMQFQAPIDGGNINADNALNPLIPHGVPASQPLGHIAPSPQMITAPPAPPKEKIMNIGGKTAKLVGDDLFIKEWVAAEVDQFRAVNVIVDGKEIVPESYKIEKLDWVKQEE